MADQPYTMSDVLAVIRTYAEAQGISAADAGQQAVALLTNNAPQDVAPAPADAARAAWRPLSYQRREELRRLNERLAAEASQIPDAAAVAAFWDSKRSEIAAIVDRLVLPSGQAALITDLVLMRATRQCGNKPAAAAGSLAAIARFLDTPGSLVQDLGLLDHVYDLCAALFAADQGRPGPLQQWLPDTPVEGGRPVEAVATLRKGLIGGGMVGMLLGGTKHGAVSTQLAAEEQVHDAFAAEGIDLAVEAPRKALQWCRRLERDAVKGRPMPALAREALDLFHVVEKTARNHLNQTGDWPLEHRAAWLAQVAYGVRTRAM